MASFVPPGYMSLLDAVREAVERWYPSSADTPDLLLAAWRDDTRNRLRGYLFDSRLSSRCFTEIGPTDIFHVFWATADAADAVSSGYHWPFGRRQRQPCYEVYLLRSEFEALFAQRD